MKGASARGAFLFFYAAEPSRRAAGNYFSAGLPKNQFPLRCPPPNTLVMADLIGHLFFFRTIITNIAL